MATEMETRRQQIQKYLNDTYGLLAQAEHKLALTANLQDRHNLRTKINEYEAYLEKWQEELTKLENEETADTTQPLTATFSPAANQAYLFNMARKAYGLGMHEQALNLVSNLRQQNGSYPGLETLEQEIALTSGPPLSIAARTSGSNPKSVPANDFRLPLMIVSGLLVLVIALMVILLVTQPSNQARSNNRAGASTVAPTSTRVIILPPAATQAPFLVATPTIGANVATVVPGSPGVVLAPPNPTPTVTR